MGVVCRPRRARTRPVKWVTNWLPAATSSCSSHVMSIMRHPCVPHHFRNSSHRLASRRRTRSKTKGSPPQPCLPLCGPNMGCVQSTSHASGSNASMVVLAWTLTESTSTTRTPLAPGASLEAMHLATLRTTPSKLRMLTAMTRTSSRCSTSSCMVSHQVTPALAAASDLSSMAVAKTWKSVMSFLAMNSPKLPKPTMPTRCFLELLGPADGSGNWGPRLSRPTKVPPRGYVPRMRKYVVISCRCRIALAEFGSSAGARKSA
mmetsp:Transcript_62314/g.140400  ORF Transcript_62314/g.140400 Transcript_62314/m.140400 type:complete len:261 (+) Transcript_62314:273-1055(+)